MTTETTNGHKNGKVANGPAAKETDSINPITLVVFLGLALGYTFFLAHCYEQFQTIGDGSAPSVFSTLLLELPVAFCAGYLVFIWVACSWMKSREAFKLKEAMIVYNLYQTLLNLWCVVAFVQEVRALNMLVVGNPMDTTPKGYRLGFIIWVHYNNKYVELLDTVFMALRQKNNQISFLHVFHHVLLIWAWYCATKYGPGGDAFFGALCNSFVHVLMYAYYLLALLKINTPWKKWLTKIQLAQFTVCFAQALVVIYVGVYPAWLAVFQIFVMSTMLVLFSNFYVKSYSSKIKKSE